MFNNLLKLELPDEFPEQDFADFMSAARSVLLPIKTVAWKEFSGASNLIGWRFRSTYEDMGAFIDSWLNRGSGVPFEEIYLRERALFGMFSSGVSCIECACYASYALASHQSVLGIPFGDREQRSCNLTRLQSALCPHLSAQPLVAALNVLINSKNWHLWVDLRNRMTHRSNIPRITYGAVGSSPQQAKALQFAATSSTIAFEADENHLVVMFEELSHSLSQLLKGGVSLVGNS